MDIGLVSTGNPELLWLKLKTCNGEFEIRIWKIMHELQFWTVAVLVVKCLVSEVYRPIHTGQGDPRHVQNEFCNDFSFPDNEHTDALIEAS